MLQSFSFRWEDHPHRVRSLGAELDGVGGATLRFAGGTWADGTHKADHGRGAVRALRFDAPGLRVHHGSTELSGRGGHRPWRQTGAEARTPVSLDLGRLGFGECELVIVVLRGFRVESDLELHPVGYTTRGLGAGVERVERHGASLRFEARLRLQAGPVPDRPQRLGRYGFRGVVSWSVLGLPKGHAQQAHASFEQRERAGVAPRRERRPVEQLLVQRAPVLATALTGFDLRVNPDALAPVPSGRYLRELEVGVLAATPNRGGERVRCRLLGHFSNRGWVSWATHVATRLDYVLLQLDEGHAREARRGGRLAGPEVQVPLA